MRKVSDHMRLVKREAGANPARTRHRDSQATAYYHWETGKGVEASERSVGRPAFRSTGMKSYRSFMPRETGSTKSAKSETILVLFCCAPRFEAMAPLYGVDSSIQLCTFRLSSLFSTASERKFPVSLIYRHIHTLLGQNFIVL
jgi:hypothetical protein